MSYFANHSRSYFTAVAILIAGSFLLRMYRITAPVIDGFWDKQVAVANRSRDMAGPPFNLLRASFDFCISEDGRRVPYTEEIPLYHALVAVGYRMFGEQDWFGRLISAFGSLAAIGGLIGLVRREYDAGSAIVAGTIFAACPLLLFYGRAVIPDACMLGGMMLAAYFFRRALDCEKAPRSRSENRLLRLVWPIAAGIAGLFAVGFKYYGLIVLIPMAEMAFRAERWRGLMLLLLPASMMIFPLAAWMTLVFFRTANPAQEGVYFLFQQPSVLLSADLWSRLADRFLWKSCGPITTIMLCVAIAGLLQRKIRFGAAGCWMATGLAFYFLLGPKSLGHEYYELMMLPGATMMAALGWRCLFDADAKKRLFPTIFSHSTAPGRLGVAALLIMVVVHSPWISDGRFRQDRGFVIAAESAQKFCSPNGRLAVGPFTPQPIIHYSHCEGWTWQEFPAKWESLLAQYRKAGGECVVLYFDRKTPAAERERYAPMISSLPVLEHRAGNWGLGESECEYFVLDLKNRAYESIAKRDSRFDQARTEAGKTR